MKRIQPGHAVQSVERATGLLEIFLGNGDKPLTVAELAKAVGLNRTTVWRLVTTLEARGYVERTSGERYRLGMKLFYFASAFKHRFDVQRVGHRVMEQLCRESAESVYLSVAVDQHRVCIHAVESSNPIRHQISVGEVMPLYAGAAAKLLLAYWPEAQREAYLLRTGLEPLCDNTIRDAGVLRQELARILEDGYAMSQDERFAGSFSVAAPVHDHAGRVAAALSITGPSVRMAERKVDFVRQVVAAAREISRLMGFREPVLTAE